MKASTATGFLILFLAVSFSLPAQIRLTEEPPVAGRENSITLEEPATEVIVTYRPNSAVIRRDTLRAPQPVTAFTWTPGRAGVVNLQTATASRNLSVRFNTFSWAGLVVMIAAAVVLFGGAGLAFRILFRDEEEDTSLDYDSGLNHHPDT